MTLTDAQLATFKADIQGNSAVAAALAAGANNAIQNWYNQKASPDFYVFTRFVDFETLRDAIDGNEARLLTRDAIEHLKLIANPSLDPSQASKRTGLLTIFPAGTFPNTRAAILAVASELATNAEKVFATGAGTQGDPAEAVFSGLISLQNVRDALALS